MEKSSALNHLYLSSDNAQMTKLLIDDHIL